MAEFSAASKRRLLTCHPKLQKLFNKVIETYDCTILWGHRGKEEQDKSYFRGFSKVKYPHSKHNKQPSMAVDVMPYFDLEPHVRWEDTESIYHFVGYVQAIADIEGIKIRSGADWDMDFEFDDQTFVDAAHFELIEDE